MSLESLLNQELQTQSLSALEADLAQISKRLMAHGHMLATAESCTGGLISAACTAVPGSSAWFERGFVTYSNEAKTEMLCVDAQLIDLHGAVSEPVARAMAAGALSHSLAQVSLAVTGIAGPGGGGAEKPVGTVWFAWATPAGVFSEVQWFAGDRADVRCATMAHALRGLLARLSAAS